jgi:hypothetical protein
MYPTLLTLLLLKEKELEDEVSYVPVKYFYRK